MNKSNFKTFGINKHLPTVVCINDIRSSKCKLNLTETKRLS